MPTLDPNQINVFTTGGGALASYGGWLYWGTMHVPFLAGLTHFDVSGAHTSFTRTITPTNPASVITCENDPASVAGSTILSNCYGNLGAGEGVIITIKLTGVTSNSASASGLADPFGLITEKVETNNSASKTVHKQP